VIQPPLFGISGEAPSHQVTREIDHITSTKNSIGWPKPILIHHHHHHYYRHSSLAIQHVQKLINIH